MYRLLFLFCICATPSLYAQFIPLESDPRDSVQMRYVHSSHPKDWQTEVDTGLFNFQQFDPTRQQEWPMLHLGTLGTAHQPLFYQPSWRMGIEAGITAYDMYRISLDSLRFYDAPKAYSKAFFTQAGNQGDSYFKGALSRNFGNQLRFTISYDRLNQGGQQAEYKTTDLLAQNTSLATGFWYQSRRRNYEAFLMYKFDVIRQKHNGGITTDTLVNNADFPGLFSIPVFLTEAFSRNDHRELRFQQHLYFSRPSRKDSTRIRSLYATHQLHYGLHRYTYEDNYSPPTANDSLVYQTAVTDVRGLRHFLKIQQVNNQFRLGYDLGNGQRVEAGLWHGFYYIDEEVTQRNEQVLYATGALRLQWKEQFRVRADAQIGLLGQVAGDFRLNGKLYAKLGAHRASAGIRLQALSPAWLHNRLISTERIAWQNDFAKEFSTSLFAKYTIPQLKLEAELRNHLLTDYIYFDALAQPAQESEALNIFQFSVRHRLRLWRFHLVNQLHWQSVSRPSIIRAPEWYSQHGLYYKDRWFKKRFKIQIGADARLFPEFFPNGFLPVTAQFYLQSEAEQAFFPVIDVYAMFEVKTFRFFFKVENLSGSLREDLFYIAHRHPLFEGNTRFGISWLFRE